MMVSVGNGGPYEKVSTLYSLVVGDRDDKFKTAQRTPTECSVVRTLPTKRKDAESEVPTINILVPHS